MSGLERALRRINFVAPVSRFALYSTRTAWLALFLAAAAVIAGHAHGALARFFAIVALSADERPSPAIGLIFLIAALLVAGLALGLAFAAAISIWVKGRRGVTRILATLALLSLLAPYPAFLMIRAGNPPLLAQISTDYDDPPQFSIAPDVVAARGFEPKALDATRRAEQSAAFPDVATITLDLDMADAYKAVREAAKSAGWRVISETFPGGAQRPDGGLELLGYSAALHLPIAVVLRLRPADDAVKVDMRSAILGLPSDLGSGADFYDKFSDALGDKDEGD